MMTPTEIVRIIFQAPRTVPDSALARQVGLSRTAVQLVLTGKLYRHVLPQFERIAPGHRYNRCWRCVHAKAAYDPKWKAKRGEDYRWCSLGYPESHNPKYAVECPAFMPGS
jgi:hypothetical protein